MEELGHVGHDRPLVGDFHIAEIFHLEESLPDQRVFGALNIPVFQDTSPRPRKPFRYWLVYLKDPGFANPAARVDVDESEHIYECQVSPRNDHSQSETVREGLFEVFDLYSGVALSLSLTPQQQSILGRETLLTKASVSLSRRHCRLTDVMLAMVNRRMSVQIIPSISFRLPSTMSSGPMLVSLTPRSLIKLSAFEAF